MIPRIENLSDTMLIGHRLTMSIISNKTGQLWGQFAPRIKEVKHRVSDDKFSLQVYPDSYFEQFNPNTEYKKWAAVAVSDLEDQPADMQSLMLEGGLYAVFEYKGSSADNSIFQYIFSQWIPGSKYEIDSRPHFELLGENYRNNDPDSEEEIWIPIREK